MRARQGGDSSDTIAARERLSVRQCARVADDARKLTTLQIDAERLLARFFAATEIALDALERQVAQQHDHPAAAAVGAARALTSTAVAMADLLERCAA